MAVFACLVKGIIGALGINVHLEGQSGGLRLA
jgi:hypothetical protein